MEGLRLVELVPVEDELCTALACVEDLGFAGRLVIYHRQTLFEADEKVCVVKRKIVLPYEGLRAANKIVREFIERRPAPKPFRLVR